jgi:hypothetical protein
MTNMLNRRSFIKTTSLSAASIAMLSPLAACDAQDKKNINKTKKP